MAVVAPFIFTLNQPYLASYGIPVLFISGAEAGHHRSLTRLYCCYAAYAMYFVVVETPLWKRFSFHYCVGSRKNYVQHDTSPSPLVAFRTFSENVGVSVIGLASI
jgi:hypothetical protein